MKKLLLLIILAGCGEHYEPTDVPCNGIPNLSTWAAHLEWEMPTERYGGGYMPPSEIQGYELLVEYQCEEIHMEQWYFVSGSYSNKMVIRGIDEKQYKFTIYTKDVWDIYSLPSLPVYLN